MRLEYSIAIDNGHVIWRAFVNNAWPALYFVDKTGRIRNHELGEGNYDRAELVIQQLLAEVANSRVASGLASVDARGATSNFLDPGAGAFVSRSVDPSFVTNVDS